MRKIGILSGLLLVALFIFMNAGIKTNGYKIGDTAKDFSLKNVDGAMMSLKDLKNAKGYIVIFTCNHCPFSVAYEDRIIALDKKYKEKGFPVVAINPNDTKVSPGDSFKNMQTRAEEKAFSFPYLYDETQETARNYGATRTPHVFLLDKDRVVRYIGAIDDSARKPESVSKTYLADAIDALLEGKEVPVSTTKAIGCTVKWGK